MIDREKVIKGLEHCIPDPNKSLNERAEENECRHAECPYGGKEYQYGMGCFWSLMSDALALLKEHEAEPHSHLTYDSDLYFTCGKCGHVIWHESYKFCPMCATRIAWNGESR